MKTKHLIGAIFTLLLILSACTNNRGVVERPAFITRNTSALEIEKVELSDTATVLYIKAFYTPKQWIRIDPNSFLTDNRGKQYTIQATEGIVMGEEFYMPESGETEFTMTFPPIASNAVFIDFSEGDYDGAWKFWGIQLTNRPLKVSLPKGFKEAAIDKNAVLPPVEFKAGKARIEGQILNYRQGMPADVSIRVANPFEYPPAAISFPIDETGKFSGEIDVFATHPAIIYWSGKGNQLFIAPGETTSLVLNPVEMSRNSSRFLKNNPPMGESVYYSGYMASLSKELAAVQPNFSLQHYDTYESYLSFLQTMGTKTPEELKTFVLEEYRIKKAMLDTLDISPACKKILQCAAEFFYATDITTITSLIDQAYIYNNQLQNDRDAINKYYASRKFDLPDDFYDVLNIFSLINDPHILYVREAAQYVYQWQMRDLKSTFSKALGTDQGILFDIMKVTGVLQDIKDFKPVDESQIAQLPADYQEFIRNKNNELLQVIEANKKKTGFTETDVANVADEDVFPFILSKFRGKPILLDVWATWCGPCRMANEALKPVKKELAGKDIVYVYVAAEDSPLETWKNMIADLPGEHFRLSAKQRSYIGKTFGIEGVPTYFYIDREGNIKEKQTGYGDVQRMKESLLRLTE